MKPYFIVVIVSLLLSSCAGLSHRKTGVVILNKSNYKKINGLYHNEDLARKLESFTNVLDIETKPPQLCKQCYIKIDAVNSRKLNVTVIDSTPKSGTVQQTFIFRGRIGNGGFVRRYAKWEVAWGPFDGYALIKCRIYVTTAGNLILDRTAFGGAGLLIFPFMIDSSTSLGTEIARVGEKAGDREN